LLSSVNVLISSGSVLPSNVSVLTSSGNVLLRKRGGEHRPGLQHVRAVAGQR
jgi:hypothetical protein